MGTLLKIGRMGCPSIPGMINSSTLNDYYLIGYICLYLTQILIEIINYISKRWVISVFFNKVLCYCFGDGLFFVLLLSKCLYLFYSISVLRRWIILYHFPQTSINFLMSILLHFDHLHVGHEVWWIICIFRLFLTHFEFIFSNIFFFLYFFYFLYLLLIVLLIRSLC